MVVFLPSASAQILVDDKTVLKNEHQGDTLKNAVDTLVYNVSNFTRPALGAPDSVIVTKKEIKYAENGLDEPIKVTARDSMDLFHKEQKIVVYGDANINYRTNKINSAYIESDFNSKVTFAKGIKDSTGRYTGRAKFDGEGQNFEADSFKYNFESKKGIVYNIITKQGDLVVHGTKTKMVNVKADSSDPKNIIYNQDAIITTCTALEPHYGIHSRKQKVIQDEAIIVGSSNLVIGNVPLPLWLPFGFFPITKKQKQGLIISRDYESSASLGFGIKNLGYFIPINDYMNLTLWTDIYLRGTYGIRASSDYIKKYKYTGNVSISYYDRKFEEENTINIVHQRSWKFNLTHNQDSKANPYQTFGGSINYEIGNYSKTNLNDAASVLNSNISSNLNYNRRFPDKPYSLSASFSHSQNNQTKAVTVSFPNLDFTLQRIFPFKLDNRVGDEKWFEKISFVYNASFRNQVSGFDSTIYSKDIINRMSMGMKQNASSDINFRVFKYFNLAPRVTYEEIWGFTKLNKKFDPTIDTVQQIEYLPGDSSKYILKGIDTTSFGKVIETRPFGFVSGRNFQADLSLTTQIFGTLRFKSKTFKGIRHVIKPSISITYNPDAHYARYRDSVQVNVRPWERYQQYYYFDGAPFSPNVRDQFLGLNYSFGNLIEAKYKLRKDSVDRKFSLFDNINVSGNYNILADSFNWSTVNVSGATRLFKGLSTLSLNATFDPYIKDSLGRRLNVSMWDKNRRLLRFENFNASLNTSLTFAKIRELFSKKKPDDKNKSSDGFFDMFDNFSISHTLVGSILYGKHGKLELTNNVIYCNGSIQLSKNWSIRVGSIGYDFKSKQMTYPDFGFKRDLHCWEMGMDWQPQRGTYSFYLRVKPSTLGFLSVPYRKNNVDAFQGF